jgi:hypothetical protein
MPYRDLIDNTLEISLLKRGLTLFLLYHNFIEIGNILTFKFIFERRLEMKKIFR